MQVDLARLPPDGLALEGEVVLPDEAPAAPDGLAVRFPAPLRVQAAVRAIRPGLFAVTGRLAGEAVTTCGRCLGPARRPLGVAFAVRYATAASWPSGGAAAVAGTRRARAGAADVVEWPPAADDGVRLGRVDLDLCVLPAGTTVLSITELVREQVLLDLPVLVLCRPDCLGLCAACGADLNAGDCPCPAPAGWGVDRGLRGPKGLDALKALKARLAGPSAGQVGRDKGRRSDDHGES